MCGKGIFPRISGAREIKERCILREMGGAKFRTPKKGLNMSSEKEKGLDATVDKGEKGAGERRDRGCGMRGK